MIFDLLEELVLLHRARGRIDRGRLLRERRAPRIATMNSERERADDEASLRKKFRHECILLTSVACPLMRTALPRTASDQVAMVSR